MAGGRGRKKKWSKARSQDKANHAVLFDEETYARLNAEIPKMKVITVSTLVDKLRISGSLARRALVELEGEGKIRLVTRHHNQLIYTRVTSGTEEEA